MALACLLGSSWADAQTASSALSAAETLLFETDHLAHVVAPAVLVYRFDKVSNVEPGFHDEVRLDLADKKGKVSATLYFLSGKNKHDLPALDDAHGNPVLLGFLERDIAEMQRLTGGSSGYFRKRVRMALAGEARVTPQSVTYRGKRLAARSVQIQPYLNDPLHARFEQYVNKTYTFILSDDVPGGIYQLRSSLANRGRPQPGAVVAEVASHPAAAGEKSADKEAGGSKTAGPQAAHAMQAAPGVPAAASLPEIDETLTLVSVTQGRTGRQD